MQKILTEGTAKGQLVQNGLTFHGRADESLLTIEDGLVSAAYDVRDSNKTGTPMIQNTVASRPMFENNYLKWNNSNEWLYITSSIKTSFIVLKNLSGNTSENSVFGIGSPHGYGSPNTGIGVRAGIYNFVAAYPAYVNNVKILAENVDTNELTILHSVASLNITNTQIFLGSEYAMETGEIYEWGWYNRVLSEQEVLINIAALNTRYNAY